MAQEKFDKKQSEILTQDLIETARELISALCGAGGRSWSLRIPPDPERDPEMVFSELCRRADYWQTRCILAEKYIAQSPCDPDIYPSQVEAHTAWQEFKNHKSTT